MQVSGDEPKADQILGQISPRNQPRPGPAGLPGPQRMAEIRRVPRGGPHGSGEPLQEPVENRQGLHPPQTWTLTETWSSPPCFATKGNGAHRVNIGALAKEWAKLSPAEQPRFPLTPVIQAWIKYLRRLEPDRRVTGIIPITTRIQGVGPIVVQHVQHLGNPGVGEKSHVKPSPHTCPDWSPSTTQWSFPHCCFFTTTPICPPSPEGTERPSP